MTSPQVVPVPDVAGELRFRFAAVAEGRAAEQLAFEAGEEAFSHGVVVVVSRRAHREHDAGIPASLPEAEGSVLSLAEAKAAPTVAGNIWTWIGIDAETRLVISYLLSDGRDADSAT